MSLQHVGESVKALIKDPISRVPHEIKMQRLKICYACEYRVKNHCGHCKCNLSWKAALKMQHCPVGIWQEWLPDNPHHNPFPPQEECKSCNENPPTNT